MSQEHAPPERDEAAAAFRANERSWNDEVIAEFRANHGEVAAPYDDPPPMLLLHTIGAKSGKEHIVPMRGLPDDESLYVFASAHGSDRQPDWYYNLVANPDITIEKGTETIRCAPPWRGAGSVFAACGAIPGFAGARAQAGSHHPSDPPRPTQARDGEEEWRK